MRCLGLAYSLVMSSITTPNIVFVSKLLSGFFISSKYLILLLPTISFSFLSQISSLFFFSFFETIFISNRQEAALLSKQALLYVFFNKDFVAITSFLCGSVYSVDSIFFSMSWQESEASEMLGLFFLGNRDSSFLFLSPMLQLNPLRKVIPTSGFYEMVLDPFFSGLCLRRVISS